MNRRRLVALAIISAVGAVGCGAAGLVGPPACSASICGLIANTRGGPAVAGAVVTVEGTTSTAVTDSQGAFSFSGLTPTTYNLLATLSGYGASRLQSVAVGSAPVKVEMLMRPVLDPAKPAVAPSISLTGLAPGDVVSGTKAFTVNVTADSSNPVRQIFVRFGHRGDEPNASVEDAATLDVTWNTTVNANGSSFVNIAAYDNNYDVAEWSVPVTISNPSAPYSDTTQSVFATAVTFGQTVGTFTVQRQAMAAAGRLRGDPFRLPLRDGRYVNIQSAPSSATLFVYAMWSPAFAATGYRVYKAFSASGPFTLLADAMSGTGPDCFGVTFSVYTLCHRDASPELSVGQTVCYRIAPYSSGGEGPQSAAACTTPLPRFNLNLTSPADETTSIAPGSSPTFAWGPVTAVGTTRFYEGFVGGVNDDPSSWWIFCDFDITSLVYGGANLCGGIPLALVRAKRYEWDIIYAFAYSAYSTGDAFSMAGSGTAATSPFAFPLSSSGSLNGPFHFTTTP